MKMLYLLLSIFIFLASCFPDKKPPEHIVNISDAIDWGSIVKNFDTWHGRSIDKYTRRIAGGHEEFFVIASNDSIELIEYNFFPRSAAVDYLEIPNTFSGKPVRIIGNSAFYERRISTLKLPAYLEIIQDAAFFGSSIEKILFNESLTIIGAQSFTLSRVRDLVIPDSVTTLGRMAFSSGSIERLTIGSGLRTISESAFHGNPITTVTFSEGLEVIEQGAFWATSIREVTIPATVYRIGSNAFGFVSVVTIGNNVMLAERTTSGAHSWWNDFAVFYNRSGKRAGTYRISERLVPGGVGNHWLHEDDWDEPKYVEAREQVRLFREAMNAHFANEDI